MGYLLGIDLGTSSVKCVLAADDGCILNIAEQEYPIFAPKPNWSEQDPESWWKMTVIAIQKILTESDAKKEDIKAIGLSGQMHGTVFLDDGKNILRSAIIWSDQRSELECQQVYERIGYDQLGQITGSGVFPGFMLASLLWVKNHEPNIWEKIVHILFPKDYVRYRLTGELATDPSDASSGILLDINTCSWSEELMNEFSIPKEYFPSIKGSFEIAGDLTKESAEKLGLCPGTAVVTGAADQATGLLGCGIISTNIITTTIGSGGQLVALLDSPRVDKELRTHTFCHAIPDSWYLLGATLSAGLAFRWLRDVVLREDQDGAYKRMVNLAQSVPAGSDGLIFLPYLIGERTVKQNLQPKGLFYGLNVRHDSSHLIRATMEGIVLSLRRVFDVFLEIGVKPEKIIASGGGARSDLWCQIIADVFQAPVERTKIKEQSAVGAVVLAGLGLGLFRNVAQGCRAFVEYTPAITPRPEVEAVYSEIYEKFLDLFKKIY